MAEFSSLNGFMVKDNTARNIAKGRNQAVAFSDYATMIEMLNATEKDEYRMGQNFYIGVVGVPDLWVYSVEDIVHNFNYISDEDVVEKLTNNTTIQAGYYKLAMLEGQKVDLTTYDQLLEKHDDDIAKHNTDIAKNKNDIVSLNTRITSFQNGVDTIANGCKTYGATPSGNTPTGIVNAIKKIYTDRYNTGYNTGYNANVMQGGVEALTIISNRVNGWDPVVFQAQRKYKLVIGLTVGPTTQGSNYGFSGRAVTVGSTTETDGYIVFYRFDVPQGTQFDLYCYNWAHVKCIGFW